MGSDDQAPDLRNYYIICGVCMLCFLFELLLTAYNICKFLWKQKRLTNKPLVYFYISCVVLLVARLCWYTVLMVAQYENQNAGINDGTFTYYKLYVIITGIVICVKFLMGLSLWLIMAELEYRMFRTESEFLKTRLYVQKLYYFFYIIAFIIVAAPIITFCIQYHKQLPSVQGDQHPNLDHTQDVIGVELLVESLMLFFTVAKLIKKLKSQCNSATYNKEIWFLAIYLLLFTISYAFQGIFYILTGYTRSLLDTDHGMMITWPLIWDFLPIIMILVQHCRIFSKQSPRQSQQVLIKSQSLRSSDQKSVSVITFTTYNDSKLLGSSQQAHLSIGVASGLTGSVQSHQEPATETDRNSSIQTDYSMREVSVNQRMSAQNLLSQSGLFTELNPKKNSSDVVCNGDQKD